VWYKPKIFQRTEDLVIEHEQLIDIHIPEATPEATQKKSRLRNAMEKHNLNFNSDGLMLFNINGSDALRVVDNISKIQMSISASVAYNKEKLLLLLGGRIKNFIAVYKRKPSKIEINKIVNNLIIDNPDIKALIDKIRLPLVVKNRQDVEMKNDPLIIDKMKEYEYEVRADYLRWKENNKTVSVVLEYFPTASLPIKKTFSNRLFDGDNRQLLRFVAALRDYTVEANSYPDEESVKNLTRMIKNTDPKAILIIELDEVVEQQEIYTEKVTEPVPVINEQDLGKKLNWIQRLKSYMF
jgi:hypothetical protein